MMITQYNEIEFKPESYVQIEPDSVLVCFSMFRHPVTAASKHAKEIPVKGGLPSYASQPPCARASHTRAQP